jgi:hypothetical protein
MRRKLWAAVLIGFGIALGALLPHTRPIVQNVSAEQARRGPAPTIESLEADVTQLKALVPSNSHIMMDVQFHWTNLWFAGRRRNWPLAQYFFNETRGHIIWLMRKSPTVKGPDGNDVDIKSIFDSIDTSSLAAVKTAIDKQDPVQFAATYKTMLESCYACHKSAGRPYLRPMIPQTQVQSLLNMDPNAAWPQ